MKCLYYLAPTLESTRAVSDDLHRVGIKDWFIHVVSNDEAGLKRERIHSSNYVETLDFVRTGLLGAWMGGMLGFGIENKKLSQFHEDIQSGQFLIRIYSRKGSGETIKAMMREKHPESEHVATDKNFISPFGEVSRIAEAAVTLGAKLR